MDGSMTAYEEVNQHINKLDIKGVFTEVAEKLTLEPYIVFSKSTKRDVADCRKIATKICIDIINKENNEDGRVYGFSAIGRVINRKHCTVMLMYKTANGFMESNKGFRLKYAICHNIIRKYNNPVNVLKREEFPSFFE